MRNQRLFLAEAFDINDANAVQQRIKLYQTIIDQTHHSGEKANAQSLMDKLIAKAKEAGSYRPSASSASSGARTSTKPNYSYSRSNPTEWTIVNAPVKESGGVKHIELSAAAMAKHGIPTSTEGYGRRAVFQKGSAYVVVYQSDNIMNGKYGVSVRAADGTPQQMVDSLVDYLTKMDKPQNDSANIKSVLAKLANMPEKDIFQAEQVGNVIFAVMRNFENSGYIVAKWLKLTGTRAFSQPFIFEGTDYVEAQKAYLAAVKKATKTQDGFKTQDTPSPNAFRVVFVGHFRDDTSDKVWGWGVKGETIYQFWGKRQGKPSLKTIPKTETNMAAVNKLAKAKEAKGYRKTTAASFADWLREVLVTDPKFKE